MFNLNRLFVPKLDFEYCFRGRKTFALRVLAGAPWLASDD
jgi:hypothetical protein